MCTCNNVVVVGVATLSVMGVATLYSRMWQRCIRECNNVIIVGVATF